MVFRVCCWGIGGVDGRSERRKVGVAWLVRFIGLGVKDVREK